MLPAYVKIRLTAIIHGQVSLASCVMKAMAGLDLRIPVASTTTCFFDSAVHTSIAIPGIYLQQSLAFRGGRRFRGR